MVQKNFAAVDAALSHLHEVKVPTAPTQRDRTSPGGSGGSAGVRAADPRARSSPATATPCRSACCRSTAPSPPPPRSGRSATSPSRFRFGTRQLCIQCGKCVLVCPHAVIRAKVYDSDKLMGAPATFKHAPARWKDMGDKKYTLQVAARIAPAASSASRSARPRRRATSSQKAINMAPQLPLREAGEPKLGLLPRDSPSSTARRSRSPR